MRKRTLFGLLLLLAVPVALAVAILVSPRPSADEPEPEVSVAPSERWQPPAPGPDRPEAAPERRPTRASGTDARVEPAPAEAIAEVVANRGGELRYCYERRLKVQPELSGSVEMAWAVEQGEVVQARAETNSTGDRQLARCVEQVASRWSFDESVDGRIRYPFTFEPTQP